MYIKEKYMDIEDRIREQRTNEAIHKNLVGFEGKLFLIAKILGYPITKQSDEQTILETDDFWNINEDEIPTFDDNVSFHDIGYFYDGLSSANRIEIICKEHEGTIKVTYKGFVCYEEESGLLLKYVPNQEWEDIVERLYKVVEERIKAKYEEYKAEQKVNIHKAEKEELERLRKKWGDIV